MRAAAAANTSAGAGRSVTSPPRRGGWPAWRGPAPPPPTPAPIPDATPQQPWPRVARLPWRALPSSCLFSFGMVVRRGAAVGGFDVAAARAVVVGDQFPGVTEDPDAVAEQRRADVLIAADEPRRVVVHSISGR